MNAIVKAKAIEFGAMIRIDFKVIEVAEFAGENQKNSFVAWCVQNNTKVPSVSWSE